jgi:RNA 3'-terminal phosphate cyclase (ATP)
MVTLDGSLGEGGGQILRTALGLSLATATPVRIENIRARRKRPGLLRQHLTAVNAAARIGRAEVHGAALGSRELTFSPGEVVPGEYSFAVGTAGSAMLVLQAVVPGLLAAPGATSLTLEGGTHNPMAPPYDFLEKAFLPLVGRMGPAVTGRLERHGFYPAGGGRARFTVQPAATLRRLDLPERGEVRARRATALVANLPLSIAERELKVVRDRLSWKKDSLQALEVESAGPGNALLLEVASEQVTEVFTSFGERGVRAEEVARRAVRQARRYLEAPVAVGEHLADQLLVPMALAGGGSFTTLPLSSHAVTNIEIVESLLDVEVTREEISEAAVRVEVKVKR